MQRSKFIICLILVATIGVACSSSEEKQEVNLKLDDFQTYTIDVDATPVRFSEQVEAVEVTYLEETEASLLDYSYRMSLFEDKLVFPSGRKGDVYVYSRQGEYISHFNHKGDGPGEYSDYNGIWMTGDTVVIFNHGKQALLYYDLDGQHLKTRKLSHMAAHATNQKGKLLFDMNMQLIDDSLRYQLMVENEAGERKGLYIPYKNLLPFSVFSSLSSFQPYGDYLTFQPGLQDTVYLIKPGEITPLLSLDFSVGYYWNDEAIFERGPAALELIEDRGQVWNFWTNVGPEHVYVTFTTSYTNAFRGLIHRSTGAFIPLHFRQKGGEDYKLVMITKNEDLFLFSLRPTQVRAFLAELNPGQVQFSQGSTLEKIEASENPTLLWVKFK